MTQSVESWQIQEMCELIRLLIDLEQPATEAEAERQRQEWLTAGYDAVVSAWQYHHKRLRIAQEAA